ncbi:MAG: YiiX/YebB-like N1pC/P60 family cysteine hydrolase [Pelagimonas sp.]|uniref:YiiX/YebB-like N1pC/P60 family cysteine hydrolase n=1 Tax=Pelagimonas sp. TaxID=2073170 RepID=UPI003D6AACEA
MQIQTGDILFQDIGCGAVCDAINGSTLGWKGAEINHCGMAIVIGQQIVVAEAIAPHVKMTALPSFLDRTLDDQARPRVILARLDPRYHALIPAAVAFAHASVGVPYDGRYGPDGSAMYCSELIVDAFWRANGQTAFFPESPMSFSDPVTGEVLPFWVRYYKHFGEEVPEGELGSNPGDLSLSDKFSTFRQLGSLRGLPL